MNSKIKQKARESKRVNYCNSLIEPLAFQHNFLLVPLLVGVGHRTEAGLPPPRGMGETNRQLREDLVHGVFAV